MGGEGRRRIVMVVWQKLVIASEATSARGPPAVG